MTISALAAEPTDTTLTVKGNTINIASDDKNLTIEIRDQKGQTIRNAYDISDNGKELAWRSETRRQSFIFFNRSHNGADSARHTRRCKRHGDFNPHNAAFYVGFNNIVSSDIEPNMARSLEIGFDLPGEYSKICNHLGVFVAMGFNWRNVKIDEDVWLVRDGKKTIITDLPEGVDLTYSRLRTFSFRIPLMLEYQVKDDDGIFVQMGVIGEITPMARIKNKYDAEGQQYTDTYKGLHHNIVGCALKATVGIDSFGLYAQYTPTRLFSPSKGPDTRTLTVGLTLCL